MPFPKRPLELYTHGIEERFSRLQWEQAISSQYCRYLDKKCDKTRKSEPNISIGTCTVGYMGQPAVICPRRFLERRQMFMDAIHLLGNHHPGYQLHVVPEVKVPGGNIDYFVVSLHHNRIADYLALEIQTLDTTGSVWPARQQLVQSLLHDPADNASDKTDARGYGVNWKMTAKTILVQMHHKAETLELLNKKIVLVMQDVTYAYITREFDTTSLQDADHGDPIHFHIYGMDQADDGAFHLELASRYSTTTLGVEQMLGLRHDAEVPEEQLLARIQAKITDATLLTI